MCEPYGEESCTTGHWSPIRIASVIDWACAPAQWFTSGVGGNILNYTRTHMGTKMDVEEEKKSLVGRRNRMKMYSTGSIRPVASHGGTAVVMVTDARSNKREPLESKAPVFFSLSFFLFYYSICQCMCVLSAGRRRDRCCFFKSSSNGCDVSLARYRVPTSCHWIQVDR